MVTGVACVEILHIVWGVASSRYTCAEVGVNGEGDYGIREQ